MGNKPKHYVTSYCNRPHRMRDGKPVRHECAVLPWRALELEREGNVEEAIARIEAAGPLRVMRRGVKE